MILITLMIPFQSILTPLFLVLRTLSLQNTLVGLALVNTTFQLPFSVFMMRNSFDSIPRIWTTPRRLTAAIRKPC